LVPGGEKVIAEIEVTTQLGEKKEGLRHTRHGDDSANRVRLLELAGPPQGILHSTCTERIASPVRPSHIQASRLVHLKYRASVWRAGPASLLAARLISL